MNEAFLTSWLCKTYGRDRINLAAGDIALAACRKSCGKDGVVDLGEVAADAGVKIVVASWRAEREGWVEWSRNCIEIFVRGGLPIEQQRWVTAHEMAHVIIRRIVPISVLREYRTKGSYWEEELVCDLVARAILIPEEVISEGSVDSIDSTSAIDVAKRVRVPLGQVYNRVVDTNANWIAVHGAWFGYKNKPVLMRCLWRYPSNRFESVPYIPVNASMESSHLWVESVPCNEEPGKHSHQESESIVDAIERGVESCTIKYLQFGELRNRLCKSKLLKTPWWQSRRQLIFGTIEQKEMPFKYAAEIKKPTRPDMVLLVKYA